jgi:RimJ/RimL family protein N-acetyltransferase
MIETPRLILRPFQEADWSGLAALLSNSKVMQFSVSGPKPIDDAVEDLGNWIRSRRPGRPERWAVTAKEDGTFLGFCGFSHHAVGGNWEWELGYRLLPSAWGRGFATEAAAACRDWLFANTTIDRFVLMIDPSNEASARVAEKIGARYEFDAVCYGVPVRIYVLRKGWPPCPDGRPG